jgi:phosphoribulokinase
MSATHPIIAVTGSSGAGTTTVMKSFAHIFRREGIKAQIIEGDSFHRYNRVEMRERVRIADSGASPPISHFGPEANLLDELAATLAEYGATGGGKVRRYIHDAGEAKELGGDAGTFTGWRPIAAGSDLLFYGRRAACRSARRGGPHHQSGVDPKAAPRSTYTRLQPGHGRRDHFAAHARLCEPHLPAVQPHPC